MVVKLKLHPELWKCKVLPFSLVGLHPDKIKPASEGGDGLFYLTMGAATRLAPAMAQSVHAAGLHLGKPIEWVPFLYVQ